MCCSVCCRCANFDSETTIEDVLTLVDFILGKTTFSAAFNNSDVNMDGELNIADVVMVVDIMLVPTAE